MHMERTGEMSASLLLVSAMSGFVLAYQYEVAAPFVSTVSVETVLPYGAFWRSVHFWSSQGFFLMLLAHVWIYADSLESFGRNIKGRIHWAVVSITIPLALYALFSGYVMRHDGTGQAAGAIAEHLFLQVPLAGPVIDRLLMASDAEGMNRVYAVHILFTLLCWGLGTWYHTRRVRIGAKVFAWMLGLSVAAGVVLHAPIDLPGQNLHLIKGPWFFLGIQELLRYTEPLVAGVLFPLVPLAAVAALPWLWKSRWIWLVLAVWSVVYGLATAAALVR